MGEISLICPVCGAEYRVPQDAIPEEGREVECSGCGHVWCAQADQAGKTRPAVGTTLLPNSPDPNSVGAMAEMDEDADDSPASAIPLRKRLPENVLNILRDEVEHERRARAAEAEGENLPGPQGDRAGEVEWPATTVTGPAARSVEHEDASSPRHPAALPIPQAKTRQHDRGPAAIHLPDSAPVQPAIPDQIPVTAPANESRTGYFMGFGLAVMIAAGMFALYLMAPELAGTGPFGDVANELRETVDRGRLWLNRG